MATISQRSNQLGTENAFVVLAEVGELQRKGNDILSFCIGMPDFPTPQNIQNAGVNAIQSGKHGYTPSAGIPELRQAASEYLNKSRDLEYDPDDVVVAAGAKPFIMYSILTTTDYGEGHEVIYPNPGFPIYESQIKVHGAVPVPLHLRESRGFNFDPAELESKINDKTRLTGWRLGFAASKALAPAFTKWVTNTESCASHITQWAGVEALTGNQSGAQLMRAKFLERRDLIVGLLNEVPGVTCLNPGGAFYVWPNVTEACQMIGAKDSEEFRKRLLLEAGVAVLADIHFGRRVPDDGQHVRFSYAASNEDIVEGINRLSKFILKNTR